MSILIKDISMPKDGEFLDLVITADGKVACYDAEYRKIAEAIELPKHGDLIDRDAMRKGWKFSDNCNRCERDAYRCQYYEEMSTMDVCGMLDDAPVVIPAERSE